jgi:hypothetical protein
LIFAVLAPTVDLISVYLHKRELMLRKIYAVDLAVGTGLHA